MNSSFHLSKFDIFKLSGDVKTPGGSQEVRNPGHITAFLAEDLLITTQTCSLLFLSETRMDRSQKHPNRSLLSAEREDGSVDLGRMLCAGGVPMFFPVHS